MGSGGKTMVVNGCPSPYTHLTPASKEAIGPPPFHTKSLCLGGGLSRWKSSPLMPAWRPNRELWKACLGTADDGHINRWRESSRTQGGRVS